MGALLREKNRPVPMSRRLSGPQSRSGRFKEGKNILLLQVIEKGSNDCLARFLATYLLNYAGFTQVTGLKNYWFERG
jgi:hypothetical protein